MNVTTCGLWGETADGYFQVWDVKTLRTRAVRLRRETLDGSSITEYSVISLSYQYILKRELKQFHLLLFIFNLTNSLFEMYFKHKHVGRKRQS